MTDSEDLPRRLAIFGAYSDHDLYQRNRLLVSVLQELSTESLQVRPKHRRSGHSFSGGQTIIARMWHTLSDSLSLCCQLDKLRQCDTIFVPYPAYLDIFWLWLFRKLHNRRLIVDAFLELHSTVVEDRGYIPANSMRARALLALQRFTLSKADIVLIDTPEQAQLLAGRLQGTDSRVVAVPVGIDENVWAPLPSAVVGDRAQVLFWGTFIPLHGIDHIVAAARILETRGAAVDVRLIGDGQMAAEIAAALEDKPATLLSWNRQLVDTATLRTAVASAHIVLGIFGTSAKAASVIPYKVHQALASSRCVITRAGPAIDGTADDQNGLIVCDSGDPEALADAIEGAIARLRAGWSPEPRVIYEQHFSNLVLKETLNEQLRAGSFRQ